MTSTPNHDDAAVVPDAPKFNGAAEKPDRVTVVLGLYHEHCCDKPLTLSPRFSFQCKTTVQPYVRRYLVDWAAGQPVDIGWATAASYVLFENITRKHHNPTPAQQEAYDASVLVISTGPADKGWLLQPGRIMLAQPQDLTALYVRGRGELSITILPR